jgi:mannose-6-phosphate isomerase-like protein (cupin superfamily)
MLISALASGIESIEGPHQLSTIVAAAEIVDIEAVRIDWIQRGFSCDTWVDPPGQCWEDFQHATDELMLLISGQLELVVDGRIWEPKIGEEVFIGAGVNHSVRNIGGSTTRWLYGYK